MDDTRILPVYRDDEPRDRRRSPVLGLALAGLGLLAVFVFTLSSIFGSADRTPRDDYNWEQVPVAPASPSPAEDPAKEAGRKLGETYNETKDTAKSFWAGFSEETSVDETFSKYSNKLDKSLRDKIAESQR